MLVEDVMTEDPVCLHFRATIGEAIRKLLESHVRHLPVLKDGVLVGMVSDRDLRSGATPVLELLADPERFAERLAEPVSSLMTSNVFSVTPDRDLQDVVELMLDEHVGAIPVVDPGSNKLVGIVSYVDILRTVREQLWG